MSAVNESVVSNNGQRTETTTGQAAANTNGGKTNGAALPAPPKMPTIQFSQKQYRINKSDYASAWVTVERKGDISQASSVECTAQDATAVGGVDYEPFSRTLIFSPKEARKRVQVRMTEGALPDDDKIVSLTLSNFNNAAPGAVYSAELILTKRTSLRSFFINPVAGRILRHVALVATLLGVIYVSSEMFVRSAESHAQKWAVYLSDSPEPIIFPADSQVTSVEQKRLQGQLDRVRARTRLHLDVMKFFYTRYYMAILTFAIAGALAAITLVLVSKRGWEASNEYVLTSFFVMTACTVFYGAFPGIFQQEQNIKENKVLYLKYDALENEILSYAVTNESRTVADSGAAAETDEKDKSKTLPASRFIHYVDEQLALGNIAIGFDYSKVPNYQDAFKVPQQ